ncbi:MAG TPA: hypothetical protein PK668_06410 [Myxococcota bacterium]|nr:hypothetical protein [Myxococcota bacterium]HRY92525.1 hypothetical protein [Myxococcota bacterium]
MNASVQAAGRAAAGGPARGGPGPAGQAGRRSFDELLRRSGSGEARAAGGRDRRRAAGGEAEAGGVAGPGAGPGWASPPSCARSSPDPAEGAARGAACPAGASGEPHAPGGGDRAPGSRLASAPPAGVLAVELCGLDGGRNGAGQVELRGRRVRCSLRAPGAPGRERLARGAAGLAAALARQGLELEHLEVTP